MIGILFLIIGIIILLIVFIICMIFATKKSESTDEIDTYNTPQSYHFEDIDTPILTNHASMRMQERLGISGYKQTEIMNDAFKYGRTADRTSGDIRIKLEDAERKYDEETVAKYYKNSIFIFTAEDNILKTVYPFDNNYNKYYWN